MADQRDAEVRLKVDNSQYNQGIKESTTNTEKFNAALTKTSDTASKIVKTTAKGLLKIGGAEIAGLTALSAVAATLEKQTSNIQANLALNKASSQYNMVAGSIRQMSREMPYARAEIAAMATSVSNLGMVTAKQIGGVTETFGKMGIATGESGTGLANAMVQFQRSMGVAQPSYQTMTPYANAVTGLSAKAGVNATDIMGFGAQFAPAARVAGLSQASVLGISTAATRAGAEGAYAANTISQILNDITQLRYTRSPELGRYARALNMDVGELTRETKGPEDQDRLMRSIISSVVGVAQTEEGPSRLSMIGIEGLRGRKALQSLAAEPGAVEKYIQQAGYGMTQPNIQTGFEKAAGGLSDQMTMLRNRMTDLGQSMGEPLMGTFTKAAEGANKFASAIQPLTDIITKFVGSFGIPLATMTMIGGGLLLVWNTISKLTLASRALWNVGTKSFVGGAQDAQMIAAGRTGMMSQAGERMMNPAIQTSAIQRGFYSAGGALGALAPGLETRQGIGQGILRSLDRTIQFIGRGVQDTYAKARMEPFARFDARQIEQQQVAAFKANEAAREAARQRAVGWRQEMGQTREEAVRATPALVPAMMPKSAVTGVPLGYTGDTTERLTTRGVVKGLASEILKAPKEAGLTGLSAVGAGTRALGGMAVERMTGYSPADIRMQQVMMGGRLPWLASAIPAAAQAAPGAIARGVGTAAMGIGRGIVGIASNPMMQIMAAMEAVNALMGAHQEYKNWQEKFTGKGGGYSDEELDNLSEYNEKLGLATRSLTQFTKGVDEANPAKSEDIRTELQNVGNVKDFGRNMDELVNARLDTIKTVEQAKEWISSQGPMNADQWVLVMRDFSKVFKNNQAAFDELNRWVQENVNKAGAVPLVQVGTPQLQANVMEEAVGGTGGGWRSALRFAPGAAMITGLVTGGDPYNLRGSEKFQNSMQALTGSQLSQAKTIGETKNVAPLFGSKARPTVDQQTALTKAEGLSQFVATVNSMLDDISGTKNPFKINEKRIALQQYIATGSEFGLNTEKWDATGMAIRAAAGRSQGDKEGMAKNVEAQIRAGAANNPTLQLLIDAGLLPKVTSGQSISSGLEDLTVMTSSQQAVAGTSFGNVPENVFEKYLGEGSLLGRGLMAAGNLSDTTDFHNATSQLLDFAEYVQKNKQEFAKSMIASPETKAAAGIGDNLSRTYALLEEMKINNPEGTQGWELANAAQARIQQQQQLAMAGRTSGEQRAYERTQVANLTPLLNVDANKQPGDLQQKLDAARNKAVNDLDSLNQTISDYNVSRAREEYDWQYNMRIQEEDYNRSRLESEEDFQRSMKRSRDAFNRQTKFSEAAFQRSLKYQEQDFYRSRQREAEAHARQMQYAAEDLAKSIGDPYHRLQLQMLSSPEAITSTMQNRLDIVTRQNQNLQTLKDRGLSEEAINQLDLANFANAQQAQNLVNTLTPEQIAKINQQVQEIIKQSGKLNQEDTGTKRAEKERDIALKNAFEDFLRGLKRTKFEHEVQVKFNKKEFEIGVTASEKEHTIALNRMADAHQRMLTRAAEQRERALQRQAEDLFGFGKKGIDMMWATTNKIIGKKGLIDKFIGYLTPKIDGLKTDTEGIISDIDAALKALDKARAAWQRQKDEDSAKAAMGGTGIGTNQGADSTHTGGGGSSSVDPKAGWNSHRPQEIWGKTYVWDDRKGKYVLYSEWKKSYPGAKMAQGGIVQATVGGMRATIAEGGAHEAVIPLNNRGIDFMSQFTKGVAKEMGRAMPKTPVSTASTITKNDHSQHVNIETVEVKNSNPQWFIKELQKETAKKRAALYKST